MKEKKKKNKKKKNNKKKKKKTSNDKKVKYETKSGEILGDEGDVRDEAMMRDSIEPLMCIASHSLFSGPSVPRVELLRRDPHGPPRALQGPSPGLPMARQEHPGHPQSLSGGLSGLPSGPPRCNPRAARGTPGPHRDPAETSQSNARRPDKLSPPRGLATPPSSPP